MWIHSFHHRCIISSHLLNRFLKIESLSQSETLGEFQKRSALKFDSLRNPNVVLRLSYVPTNNPNATPRSTHNLRQIVANALGINTSSHDELEMRADATTNEKAQPIERDTPEKYPKDKNK